MKWNKTSEILPETNRQLLLLLSNYTGYEEYYEMPFTNIVMGVYLKNRLYNQKDAGCLSEYEYFFEGLCCNIHLPISDVIAWSYVPSVSKIESSFT